MGDVVPDVQGGGVLEVGKEPYGPVQKPESLRQGPVRLE